VTLSQFNGLFLVVGGVGMAWVAIGGFEPYPAPIIETCPMICQPRTPEPPVFEDMESGVFVATGYAIGPPYASIVRSGQPVVNRGFMSVGDIELFTVAVDPKVIPLGSVLWIEGLGLGMASDTGRLIKGRRIDICFTTMREAWYFGKKSVEVVMLRSGR